MRHRLCRVHNPTLTPTSGGSRGGARSPPLILDKKEEMTEGKMAAMASKSRPGPRPAIGRHLEENGLSKSDLKDKQFSVLRKCRTKFDCLIFEMLFIKELKPGLNTQKDSHLIVLYFTLQGFVFCSFIFK